MKPSEKITKRKYTILQNKMSNYKVKVLTLEYELESVKKDLIREKGNYQSLKEDMVNFETTNQSLREDINDLCKFARQMSTICEFPDYKQVPRIKQHLNACIRADIELDDITLEALAHDNNCDVNVLRLWKLVESIKMDMFTYIDAENTLECYIGEDRCDHEGYVLHN